MRPDEKASHSSGGPLVVGLDASRSRSGGAIAHVVGLLGGADPAAQGIGTVHLWAHDGLLGAVRPAPWLVLHEVPASRGPIWRQLWWQRMELPRLARKLGVHAMFNTDAGSVCPFQPSMTLSQDMLSYEPGEMQRYPWPSRARLRLEILRLVQLQRLRRSTVAVFLTRHASDVIGALTPLAQVAIIPHGIDEGFSRLGKSARHYPTAGPIRALYVSNAAPYKHQWHVVDAVARVRAALGVDLRLRLVGGGRGPALARLNSAVLRHDASGSFVERAEFVSHSMIAEELRQADLFVYASSCENLPVTLLEAMASGLPIAVSDRGPMPEVIGPDGCFFDPEAPESIAAAISQLIVSEPARQRVAFDARNRSSIFTWKRCAEATWTLLASLAATKRT